MGSSGAWVQRRFGSVSEDLRRIVPGAMAEADALAFRSSVEGEMTTGHVYGTGFWLKSNQILIARAEGIPGLSIRRLKHVRRHFDCVVVDATSTVLVPIRVEATKERGDKVRLHNPPSNSLAYLLGPSAVHEQPDTLDNELFGVADLVDQASDIRELDRQMSDFAAVVAIAVECTLQGGVSGLTWGDLQLVEGERLSAVWSHSEPLEFIRRGVDLSLSGVRDVAVGESVGSGLPAAMFDRDGRDDADAVEITLKPGAE